MLAREGEREGEGGGEREEKRRPFGSDTVEAVLLRETFHTVVLCVSLSLSPARRLCVYVCSVFSSSSANSFPTCFTVIPFATDTTAARRVKSPKEVPLPPSLPRRSIVRRREKKTRGKGGVRTPSPFLLWGNSDTSEMRCHRPSNNDICYLVIHSAAALNERTHSPTLTHTHTHTHTHTQDKEREREKDNGLSPRSKRLRRQ